MADLKKRTAYVAGGCIIIRDLECGVRDRWTTISEYKHEQNALVIGRELTLKRSKKIAAEWNRKYG